MIDDVQVAATMLTLLCESIRFRCDWLWCGLSHSGTKTQAGHGPCVQARKRCRMPEASDLYLDLLKRTLTFLVYGPETFAPIKRPRSFIKGQIYDALRRWNVTPMRSISVGRETRTNGRDWPPLAYTMIGMKRLNNLENCAVDVLRNDIPGDFIEAGREAIVG